MDILLASLEELGYKALNFVGKPQPLVGYQGDFRTVDGIGHTKDADLAMKADIIIPRSQVGSASNDIGFKRNTDGTYSAIISDYDSGKHNQKWMNSLSQSYQVRKTMQDAKRAGVRNLSQKKLANGDIELVYLKQ